MSKGVIQDMQFGTLKASERARASRDTAPERHGGEVWLESAWPEVSARSGFTTFTPCVGGWGESLHLCLPQFPHL